MNINRSPVQVNLFDVSGKRLRDKVTIKLYNQRLDSLSRRHKLTMKGRAVILRNVPAFPHGRHEAFISASKFRAKSLFINVPAGKLGLIGNPESKEEAFFVDPDKAEPAFPDLDTITTASRWAELSRVLKESQIQTEAAWRQLGNENRAGLFNLYAKMQAETVETPEGTKPVFSFVDRITQFLPARIFCIVRSALLDRVREDGGDRYRPVSGALHEFPDGWRAVRDKGSFKTPDKAGNLQVTFARSGEFDEMGQHLIDADIDDHAGIQHAFDVLKHKITREDTHPYDIHQILTYFQDLKPGYSLT